MLTFQSHLPLVYDLASLLAARPVVTFFHATVADKRDVLLQEDSDEDEDDDEDATPAAHAKAVVKAKAAAKAEDDDDEDDDDDEEDDDEVRTAPAQMLLNVHSTRLSGCVLTPDLIDDMVVGSFEIVTSLSYRSVPYQDDEEEEEAPKPAAKRKADKDAKKASMPPHVLLSCRRPVCGSGSCVH